MSGLRSPSKEIIVLKGGVERVIGIIMDTMVMVVRETKVATKGTTTTKEGEIGDYYYCY